MSDLTAETYERNGLEVEIYYDDMAENPLETCTPEFRGEGGVYFALKHNRYNLPWEIEADTDDFDSYTELAEAVTAKGGELAGYNYRFVNWYEHSMVAVSLRDAEQSSDQWDAGIAGVIFGKTTDDINREFEPWKAYTEGDIYGYTITNPRDGEVVDSCCGFYGYDDVKQCANGEADGFKWPHEAAYAKDARAIHGGAGHDN